MVVIPCINHQIEASAATVSVAEKQCSGGRHVTVTLLERAIGEQAIPVYSGLSAGNKLALDVIRSETRLQLQK